jgi:hypothetical protein
VAGGTVGGEIENPEKSSREKELEGKRARRKKK